jgi:hypothetical protein
VDHAADFLSGFSTEGHLATVTADSGRNMLYQNKSAINQKNLID